MELSELADRAESHGLLVRRAPKGDLHLRCPDHPDVAYAHCVVARASTSRTRSIHLDLYCGCPASSWLRSLELDSRALYSTSCSSSRSLSTAVLQQGSTKSRPVDIHGVVTAEIAAICRENLGALGWPEIRGLEPLELLAAHEHDDLEPAVKITISVPPKSRQATRDVLATLELLFALRWTVLDFRPLPVGGHDFLPEVVMRVTGAIYDEANLRRVMRKLVDDGALVAETTERRLTGRPRTYLPAQLALVG